MTMHDAIRILGINRARYEVQNMAIALMFGSYLNTKEETDRLNAAAYVLKRWKQYATACNAERDKMIKRQ